MASTRKTMPYPVTPGHRYPVGASVQGGDINFCVFSRHATRLWLQLYDHPESTTPFQTIELVPEVNRTFFFWHVCVRGVAEQKNLAYTWRAHGPDSPRQGHRFNPEIELLDPWARAITDTLWQRPYNKGPKSRQSGPSMRGVTVSDNGYDWQGDTVLSRPCNEEIIYELHVRGFTRHESAGVRQPGTFAGLIEKIPYLRALGINVVELMPIMAFDEQDLPDRARDLGLKNYWGYATHSFFSPHPGYCVNPLTGGHRDELRDLIRALHRAGISVILDVAFNHTAEGGVDGPTINFKGLLNRIFYHLEENDPSQYKNFSGCGNTVNCNHPLVARFIVECLEYWVFILTASALTWPRSWPGARMASPCATHPWSGTSNFPISWPIAGWWPRHGMRAASTRWAASPAIAGPNGTAATGIWSASLSGATLIAEFATRLTGSSDLYQAAGRRPSNSINFVTCHDGFTLYDLVSYNHKHNQANGEDNRDGESNNYSWNCGVEGPTKDSQILALRRRLVKNFMAILLLSQGVPMLLAGDEVLRTQQGNNNCYCQDNELSWFDWDLIKKNADMLRFTREMIRLRKRHPALRRATFLTGKIQPVSGLPDIRWHGRELDKPAWHDPEARLLACTLSRTEPTEPDLHMIFNMDETGHTLPLPDIPGRTWFVAVDTGATPPDDILEPEGQHPLAGTTLRAAARSVVVLEARPTTP